MMNILQTLNAFILPLILILFFSINPTLSEYNFTIAKPGCVDRCGDIRIPYPFGTTENCYQHYSFFVTCNETSNKLVVQSSSIEVTNISLDGQMKILQYIVQDCYASNVSTRYSRASLNFPPHLTVNNTANKFTIMGCDTYGYVSGRRFPSKHNYTTGCITRCDSRASLEEGSCKGSGCCKTSIPSNVSSVDVRVYSFSSNYKDVLDFNDCGYAFVGEDSAFTFSADNLTNLRNVGNFPMVVDWAIGDETCDEAKMNRSAYACVSQNSMCYKPENGYGYRCRCWEGYQGNPYLIDGCLGMHYCASFMAN